jgi:hypothetical protein
MNRVAKNVTSTLFTILIFGLFSLAANASPESKQLAAGPGTPTPVLPTTKDGNYTGMKLVAAGPGTPTPVLPTTKDGNFTGMRLVAAGPGTPTPVLPTTKDGNFTGTRLS